jgi:hypothetical protein
MKRIAIFILCAAFALSLSVTAFASRSPVSICSGFSEFQELLHMAENATDDELHDFLNNPEHPCYAFGGIKNRDDVNEFITAVRGALIPVTRTSTEWIVSIYRGTTKEPLRDHGNLDVIHWFSEDDAVSFTSYYNPGEENLAAMFEFYNLSAFSKPTARRNGAQIFQFTDTYHCDFVIIVGDYLLNATIYGKKTPQERLNTILKFSYERLDSGKTQFNSRGMVERDLLREAHTNILLAVIAAGVVLTAYAGSVIWRIVRKRKKLS